MLRARGASLQLARRPGSRRASRACRGHASQRARRDAEHARLPLSVTATAVTPSPPGKGGWVARARARLPYGRPASRGGCALRHGREKRRPPAEADGDYSCASGHAAGTKRRSAPVLAVQAMIDAQPKNQVTQNSKRGMRGQRPWPRASASRCALREPCPQSTCMTPPRVFSMTGGAQPNREPGVGTAHRGAGAEPLPSS